MAALMPAAPGDVLAVPGGGAAGWLVRVGEAMTGKATLAGHVVGITHQDSQGRWMGIQGRPGGVGLTDCTAYLSDSRVRSNHAQPRPDDAGQLTAFLASCVRSLGLRYDWAGIASDVAASLGVTDLSADIDRLWRWPAGHGQLPGDVVCSSLFAMLYALPQSNWLHPDLGVERSCEPSDWWLWSDEHQWAGLPEGDVRRQRRPLERPAESNARGGCTLDVTATPATGTAAAARSVYLNPVSVAWSVNMGVTLLAGFGLQLPRAPVAAVAVICPALVAVVTALAARPWYIPGVTGAVTSVLAACAAFGLQWTPEQVAAGTAALSVILMLVTHAAVTPVAALRQGLTATEIQLGRGGGRQVAVISPAPARQPGPPDLGQRRTPP